jgi:hypothetical protein
MANPEKGRIKVTDRRHFTPQGERRAPETQNEENSRRKDATGTHSSGPASTQAQPQPSIEFETLVLSLTRQALMLLGEEPDPQGNKVEPQVDAARSVVDMLMAVREKTRGNLTADEESLMRRVIYELQMKITQKMKS